MSEIPPPIIDSARLLAFALNDEDVKYTDRINLFVGSEENLERLGEVPCLAICSDCANPDDILLFFCNSEWEPQGVIPFTSTEEAMLRSERGYQGISDKWQDSPYNDEEIKNYLRDEYEVDPNAEWWKMRCSFCGKDDSEVEGIIQGARATICKECIESFYMHFQCDNDA